MKTKVFLVLCLLMGIGLTKLSAQPAIGKSGNWIRDETFGYFGTLPLNCDFTNMANITGTVRCHTVTHYSNYDGDVYNFDWCRQEFHGEFTIDATDEVFKVNDIFTLIGPYTQPGTGHANYIGSQGSHYIVNYLWDDWADPNDITIVSVKCPGDNYK
jgi:hypothetical protein